MPESSPQRRIAVIGGGLSGLAAAHRLIELRDEKSPGMEVTLFEAASRLGGVIGTERIGDYLVDTGADSFLTNKPGAVGLCRRLGIADQLTATDKRRRGALVLYEGQPVPVPDGFQLLSPTAFWPMATTPLLSPWGKLRMLCEYFVPRRKRTSATDDESLADFARRRFGREALDRLIQPLVGGIYTADPEHLSLAATMPRFLEMEAEHGSLIRATLATSRMTPNPHVVRSETPTDDKSSGARYGLFAGLKGGMEDLLQALRSRLETTCQIRLSTPIIAIEQRSSGPAASSGGPFLLTRSNGTTESFDGVVLATTAPRAAALVWGFDSELSEALLTVPYASSALVVTGHRLSDIRHPMNSFGLVVPHREHRRILAVSFSSRKFPDRAPAGSILLRTFVGGALQPEMLSLSDEELVATVRSELNHIFGVQGSPEFARVYRYPNAMPQYHVGHLSRVARIEELASRHNGLVLCGNAYRGVGVPDVITNSEAAAERIATQIPTRS